MIPSTIFHINQEPQGAGIFTQIHMMITKDFYDNTLQKVKIMQNPLAGDLLIPTDHLKSIASVSIHLDPWGRDNDSNICFRGHQ